jgi:hypothetical protein
MSTAESQPKAEALLHPGTVLIVEGGAEGDGAAVQIKVGHMTEAEQSGQAKRAAFEAVPPPRHEFLDGDSELTEMYIRC